jgi:hypothetical protein
MGDYGMARATHLSYSSDLVSSDFYLFGHMKHCLRAETFEAAHELVWAIE